MLTPPPPSVPTPPLYKSSKMDLKNVIFLNLTLPKMTGPVGKIEKSIILFCYINKI